MLNRLYQIADRHCPLGMGVSHKAIRALVIHHVGATLFLAGTSWWMLGWWAGIAALVIVGLVAWWSIWVRVTGRMEKW
jgi:hypothetical protein